MPKNNNNNNNKEINTRSKNQQVNLHQIKKFLYSEGKNRVKRRPKAGETCGLPFRPRAMPVHLSLQ